MSLGGTFGGDSIVGNVQIAQGGGLARVETTGAVNITPLAGQKTTITNLVPNNSSLASAGVIRWTGVNFEGYNGTGWVALDVQAIAGGGGWTEDVANNRIYATTGSRIIGTNTADGADSGYLRLSGGGAVSDGRGAYAILYGNEEGSFPGRLSLGAGNAASGFITFGTGAGVERLRITQTGNFGFGTSDVEAWSAAYKALQLGDNGIAWLTNAYRIFQNAYDDGAYKYRTTAAASLIEANTGAFLFKVAASGTIDTAITWTTAFQIDNAGRVAVGSTTGSATTFYVIASGLSSGTTQYGILADSTPSSGATTESNAIAARAKTAAAAYTATLVNGIHILDVSKGAGSTITTQVGLYIDSQTQGATNYAIYTSGGWHRFYGNVAIGTNPTTAQSLYINNTGAVGAITVGAAQYGINIYQETKSDATNGYVIYVRPYTQAAAFTLTGSYGIRIDDVNKGAGSSITNQFGLYVADQTQGTNNYALYTNTGLVRFGDAVSAPSGINVTNATFTASAPFVSLMGGRGTNSQQGRIRIGSASPAISNSESFGVIEFYNSDSSAAAGVYALIEARAASALSGSGGVLAFQTAGSGALADVLTITETGAATFSSIVGIGTAWSGRSRFVVGGTQTSTSQSFGITTDNNLILQPAATFGAATASIGGGIGRTSIQIAGSGVHPLFASVAIYSPTILGGVGTLTEAATLWVEGQPTGATNNYALHVNSGLSLFGGNVFSAGYFKVTTSAALVTSAAGSMQFATTSGLTFVVAAGSTYDFAVADSTGAAILSVPTGTRGLVIGSAAIATNATGGFLYIPSCAGVPSGVPTAFTGRIAIVYDTTDDRIYAYNGAWKLVNMV